jgi:uncharacterized membrane protein SpoIIM required for sporulation
MRVQQFVAQRRASWNELGEFLGLCSRSGLPRIPLEAFERGSLLYREAASDLALARIRFPGHPLVRELEALVGNAHSIIYRARIVRRRNWARFWVAEYPALVRANRRYITAAFLIFWAAALAGAVLTLRVPALADAFVSARMWEALKHHHLWTESLTSMSPQASSSIAANNITVSLTMWALGIGFGIGTVYLTVVNGLMLGAVAVACLRFGMLGSLLQFIVAHGALELPALWIAGGAGMLLGRAMLVPGRYARGTMLRIAARQSMRIAIGTVPILLVAGTIEGFISPSSLPAAVKLLTALVFGLCLLTYLGLAGRTDEERAALPAGLEADPAL